MQSSNFELTLHNSALVHANPKNPIELNNSKKLLSGIPSNLGQSWEILRQRDRHKKCKNRTEKNNFQKSDTFLMLSTCSLRRGNRASFSESRSGGSHVKGSCSLKYCSKKRTQNLFKNSECCFECEHLWSPICDVSFCAMEYVAWWLG